MRSMTVILAGVLSFSVLAAQTRVAGPNEKFGQVTIMSMVTGNINGRPVSGFGYGMLDTTGLFPSTYDIQYDSVVDCPIPLTLLPCQLEAESGALDLWQLSGGQFTCSRTYKWPSYPGDSVHRAIHSTVVGCTLVVHDSLFGSSPDPGDGPWEWEVAHWAQVDSATVSEQCTLGYVRASGDTLLTTVTSRLTGLRQRLPTPEVSKTYFPSESFSNNHSSITWWGRTMPENHGRQIDALCTVDGVVNSQSVSGRVWGMVDTTGLKPAYLYGCFESLSVSNVVAWAAAQGFKEYNLRASHGAPNLWDLSGGNYQLVRTASFDSGDTIAVAISAYAAGTTAWQNVSLSGSYHGPNDIVDLLPENKLWHPVDTSTMSENGRTTLRRSNGDSVVCTFAGTYQGMSHQLDFDEAISLSFSKVRDSGGFFALEVQGTVDSATSAVSEHERRKLGTDPSLLVSPNPVSINSVIRYSLPRAGNVSLKLFDASGRTVGTLMDSRQPAGEHVARLQGTSGRLGAGVYVVRLEANGTSTTTRLVLTPSRQKPATTSIGQRPQWRSR
jgi:hypothetical protein